MSSTDEPAAPERGERFEESAEEIARRIAEERAQAEANERAMARLDSSDVQRQVAELEREGEIGAAIGDAPVRTAPPSDAAASCAVTVSPGRSRGAPGPSPEAAPAAGRRVTLDGRVQLPAAPDPLEESIRVLPPAASALDDTLTPTKPRARAPYAIALAILAAAGGIVLARWYDAQKAPPSADAEPGPAVHRQAPVDRTPPASAAPPAPQPSANPVASAHASARAAPPSPLLRPTAAPAPAPAPSSPYIFPIEDD